jgi:Flp pilus assembly pilin Flp
MNSKRPALVPDYQSDSVFERLIVRLLREDSGQDVIEYALLCALIGTVGILAWQSIGTTLGAKYLGWDTGLQSISSCTPDPGGGGC